MNARSASSLTPNQLAVMALDSAEGKLLQGLSTAGQKSIARRELARRWHFSEKQLTDTLQKLTLRGMVRSNRGRVQITSAGVDVVESAKTMPASVADSSRKTGASGTLTHLVSDFFRPAWRQPPRTNSTPSSKEKLKGSWRLPMSTASAGIFTVTAAAP